MEEIYLPRKQFGASDIGKGIRVRGKMDALENAFYIPIGNQRKARISHRDNKALKKLAGADVCITGILQAVYLKRN